MTPGDFTFGQRCKHLLSWLGHRITGKDYRLEVELFGRPAVFAVTSKRELKRVSDVSYEGSFLGRILSHLQEGDVFFDVGANIGLVSVIVGQRPEMATGKVLGFEPEPKNLAHLRRNLEINNFGDRAEAHGVALGADSGQAALHVRGTVGDGRHSLVASEKAVGAIEVEVAPMSAFCESAGVEPDVVKIDVEGAEGVVLAGMEPLLRKGRPRELFMEIHNKGGKDRMPDDVIIDDHLATFGYQLVWKERRGQGEHRHFQRSGEISESAV
ncbi:MAG: hypothetical protein SynsKO_12660 [Synoicihabitans sp.]